MFKYIYTKHFMSKEIEEGGGEGAQKKHIATYQKRK